MPINVWPTPPISDNKIMPSTLPPDVPALEISVRGCRGESVPISFCVRSDKPLVGLAVEVLGAWPWKIDIRYVKRWWQSGDKSVTHGSPTYTPELLLHDPGLVDVGMTVYQRNVIRRPVQDATELQPSYLAADYTRQFWGTILIPEDAECGNEFKISVSTQGKTIHEIPVSVKVLPFELKQPNVEYAIYYRGKLRDAEVPESESEYKTLPQYQAEMENILRHGVTTPIFYQRADDRLEEVIEIRKSIGLQTESVYLCGGDCHTGDTSDEIELANLKIRMLERRIQLTPLGVRDIHFYGRDEATGPALIAQRAAWQAVHEAGGKVFVASYKTDLLKHMGDLIDVAILYRKCVDQIPAYHDHGARVWLYGDPQTTWEYPATYRRNYGLQLLAEGWDGACPYAYQHSCGDTIWDDFDHDRVRDHVMAYPTIDGVVDTIQWEGFYAGVMDARYAATLEALGGTVPAIDGRDLDEVRAEMIDLILLLI